jgi:hypothetical protein
VTNPFDASLDELVGEQKRLDALLDEAVARYALVEEDMNARMKAASPQRLQELMAERAQIEESLGIVELVERIDVIRGCIAVLRGRAGAAA